MVDVVVRTAAPPDVLHDAVDGVRRLVSLCMRYHRPVPLDIPLRVHAHVTETAERRISVAGSIATENDPATLLVTARGVFVSPNPDHARALFPSLRER